MRNYTKADFDKFDVVIHIWKGLPEIVHVRPGASVLILDTDTHGGDTLFNYDGQPCYVTTQKGGHSQ